MDFESPKSEIAPDAFKNVEPEEKTEEFKKGSDWYEKQKQLILDERIDVDKVVEDVKASLQKTSSEKEEAKIISIQAAREDALKKLEEFQNKKAA